MRVVAVWVVVTMLWVSSAGGQEPAKVEPPRQASGSPTPKHDAEPASLFRYEPTGLSLLQPYRRGKVPVVLVHGLWSNPWSWAPMVEALETDPWVADRFQFWTFGYSTGDPFLYSASLLRHDLEEVRRKFDPEALDPAFDRMVLVGHSMGGLLTKMMVQDSGSRLWEMAAERPFEDLAGLPEDRALVRRVLVFRPRPEVRRVVFIATPHRGSRVDRGKLESLGSRLVRIDEPLRISFNRLLEANDPTFFKERLRKGLPTSIDELEWGSPVLKGLDDLAVSKEVKVHSIIADRRDPPVAGGGDGLVPYESAHLEGAISELLVPSGHQCQARPAVIREVRRILAEHEAR